MSAGRAFFDAIDQAKRKRREAEADDVEMGDYDDQIGDELADREVRDDLRSGFNPYADRINEEAP